MWRFVSKYTKAHLVASEIAKKCPGYTSDPLKKLGGKETKKDEIRGQDEGSTWMKNEEWLGNWKSKDGFGRHRLDLFHG